MLRPWLSRSAAWHSGVSRACLSGAFFLGLCVALPACGGDSDSSSKGGKDCSSEDTGDEGCACYPNKTCNGKLSCHSKLCVDATGLGADDETDDGKPSGSGSNDEETESDESSAEETDSEGNPVSKPEDTDDATPTKPSQGDTDESDNPDGPVESDTPANSSNPEDTDNPTPVEPVAGDTPVGRHGQLHVAGTKLTDEHGAVTQLKGVSSMWLNWEPTGYAESLEGLRWMRDNWKLQIIRAAMGVAQEPGDGAYIENPEKAKKQVHAIVQNAIELGVYVIIDWHDHNGEQHQAEAEAFFSEMAEEYAGVPNVLYELFNEPLDVDWDTVLKPYHTAVSGAIRAHDPDNVIILGTPNWSQDVDIAALNPVVGSNLMYTLHFYACDHTGLVRNKGISALANNLPIFVTEWGATPADGGTETPLVCEAEANDWHDWMDQEGISWAAWKLDGCSDSSCFFTSRSAPVDGGWTADMLNGHAPYVISKMQAVSEAPPQTDPVPPDPPVNGCTATGSCAAGDRMDCDAEGNLIAGDCSGCGLLLCTNCCASVGYFAATDTQGDFTLDQSLITNFEQSATAASISASFTQANQMGAIAFALDGTYAIDPYSVVLSLDATGGEAYVSLENGSAGCLYPLYASGDVIALDPDYANCWGSALPGDPVGQINVRVDSLSSGTATLSFFGMDW